MSFILVSKQGAELQVSGWNWRPTVELVRNAGLLTDDTFELMSAEGYGWHVDCPLADQIAELIEAKLVDMRPGQRMLSDLTIASSPKDGESLPDSRDSASYGWLLKFRDFCRRSGGFEARGEVDGTSESDVLQRVTSTTRCRSKVSYLSGRKVSHTGNVSFDVS